MLHPNGYEMDEQETQDWISLQICEKCNIYKLGI